jgi:hypothetical protein
MRQDDIALAAVTVAAQSRGADMLARKDWLPAAVRAVGVKRKLKAGQTLFRLGSRTVGLLKS